MRYFLLLIITFSITGFASTKTELNLLHFNYSNVWSNTAYETSWAKGILPKGRRFVKELRIGIAGQCASKVTTLGLWYESNRGEQEVKLDKPTKYGTYLVNDFIYSINYKWYSSVATNHCEIFFYSVGEHPKPEPTPGSHAWDKAEATWRTRYLVMDIQQLEISMRLASLEKTSDYSALYLETEELIRKAKFLSKTLDQGLSFSTSLFHWKEFKQMFKRFRGSFLGVHALSENLDETVEDDWRTLQDNFDKLSVAFGDG